MKNARFDGQGPLSNWSDFDCGSTRRDLVLASPASSIRRRPRLRYQQTSNGALGPLFHHTLAKWRLFMVVWTSPDLISC
jgi:hypothetical protein